MPKSDKKEKGHGLVDQVSRLREQVETLVQETRDKSEADEKKMKELEDSSSGTQEEMKRLRRELETQRADQAERLSALVRATLVDVLHQDHRKKKKKQQKQKMDERVDKKQHQHQQEQPQLPDDYPTKPLGAALLWMNARKKQIREAFKTNLAKIQALKDKVKAGGSPLLNDQELRAKVKKEWEAIDVKERQKYDADLSAWLQEQAIVGKMDGKALVARVKAEWHNMSPQGREVYETKATQVHAQYEQDLEEWHKKNQHEWTKYSCELELYKAQQKKQKKRRRDDAEDEETETDVDNNEEKEEEERRKRYKKRHKKKNNNKDEIQPAVPLEKKPKRPPGMPRKPTNADWAFKTARIQVLKEEATANKGQPEPEYKKLRAKAKKEWEALSDEEQWRWKDKSTQARQKYDNDLAVWLQDPANQHAYTLYRCQQSQWHAEQQVAADGMDV